MKRALTLRTIGAVAVALFVAGLVAAQVPTGTLTGRVTYQGQPMPGVTVTVTSPALQGAKTVVTSETGDYLIPFLPAGTYKVTFSLDQFRTLESEVKISAAQTRRLDAKMVPAAYKEEIQVTGSYETISDSIQSQTTYTQELIEKLPVARTITQAALLAPGVTNTGPNGNVTIAGSMSFENLWMINGVVVNENIRGQALPLYIEDAVQETTISTSGVSAEYGRFQGGVINVLTKSGGNEFSGSYRLNLSNDKWVAKTPLSPDRTDELNKTHEATFGGYVLKDKLWFFLAGRSREFSETRETNYTRLPYPYSDKEERFEAKLTYSLNPSHRFIYSFIDIDRTRHNTDFGTIYDYASLNPNRQDPQDLRALNYTGVLSDTFFVEAQYSKRRFVIGRGSGSPYTDIIRGTLLRDRSRSGLPRYHTPTFCSAPECGDEKRDNEDWLAKMSYFYSSETLGSHEIVFGYDQFTDIRKVDNHQQGSDFRIYCSTAFWDENDPNKYVYPVCAPRGNDVGLRWTYAVWTPILESSKGTDFKTKSLFINDTWRYNERWTFNIGFRYDQNDGVDSSGSKVSDDSRISPRLGASWDVKGDGDIVVSGSFGHYVGALANGIANDGSGAGNPAWVVLYYLGPCLNCDAYDVFRATGVVPPDTMTQEEVIQAWYDWFQANGGIAALPGLSSADLPGFTPKIDGSLASPYTEEFSVGVTKRLGTRGMVRVDYVHRSQHDFYVSRTEVGRTVHVALDDPPLDLGDFDLELITNDDNYYERKYDGLHTNFQYRLSDTVEIGGNWTWSHAIGNLEGETWNSGPVTGGGLTYPEYRQKDWNAPRGNLGVDQRHQARAWLVWSPVSTPHHNLSISVMENFWSGGNYSITEAVDVSPYVTNPGYLNPPSEMTYFFSGRGTQHWDNVTRTDLAVNYSFFLNVFGRDLELFVQPEVLNLFNEQAQVGGRTTIDLLEPFNPFTEKPIEGVHWRKRDNFGEPVDEGDYQMPRTFQISLGIRF